MIKITVSKTTRRDGIVNEIVELKKQNDRIEMAMHTAEELGLETASLEFSIAFASNLKTIYELEDELQLVEYEEMLDTIAEERLLTALMEGGLI